MANKLQILSNGESFDLFDGEAERFYITYQIHDLSNLETRNGNFSRRVNLPLTSKNKGILDAALPTVARFDTNSVGITPCEILVNDMPALSDAYFIIDTQQENSVSIQIFGGISKFYSDLPDTSIREFTYTDIIWTDSGLQSLMNTSTDIVIANAQWTTNQTSRLLLSSTGNAVQELIESGFFIYTKSILDKIFAGFTNLTFDSSAMDASYSKYAIACSVDQIHKNYINSETVNTTVTPQNFFPDISQRDFVREVFKLQNIVAVESNNVVTLKYFKSLQTETPKTLVLNYDKEKTVYNTFTTYSQTNELKYSDDDIIERTDVNDSFPTNSETLPLKGTAIQSKFFACDLGESGLNFTRACVPCWQIEEFRSDYNWSRNGTNNIFSVSGQTQAKIGDLVTFSGELFRIVTIDADKRGGTVDRTLPSGSSSNPLFFRYKHNSKSLRIVSIEDRNATFIYSYNGEIKTSPNPTKEAQFVDALKWSELKTEYYQLLVDTMAKPFIIQAWINIPTISLLEINPLAPVYIEEYNAYFYINKLEQWKLNTGCRVELIQIPK